MAAMGIAAGMMAAGSLLGAYSSYQMGKEQAAAYGREAGVSRMRAQELIRRADLQKGIMQRESKYTRGLAQTALAGQGFATTSSSRSNIELDYARQLQEDIATLDAETRFEVMLEEISAQEALTRASQAKKAGKYGAVSSILTGGSNVAGMYSRRS